MQKDHTVPLIKSDLTFYLIYLHFIHLTYSDILTVCACMSSKFLLFVDVSNLIKLQNKN